MVVERCTDGLSSTVIPNWATVKDLPGYSSLRADGRARERRSSPWTREICFLGPVMRWKDHERARGGLTGPDYDLGSNPVTFTRPVWAGPETFCP